MNPRPAPTATGDATPLAPSDPLLAPLAEEVGHRQPLRIARVETFVYRVPIEQPVITSFGIMHDRPAVLVRVEDTDGAVGWGEVWSNFPACGAEHRARLVETALAPPLLGTEYAGPADAFASLERKTRALALQSGEWGPLAQALAGVDIALWDLTARRAELPLARLLGGEAALQTVPTYASGINLKGAAHTVELCRAEGFRAFKVKVGFGAERDLKAVRAVVGGLHPDEALMLDANQAWDLSAALDMTARLADLDLEWLEEPLPADRPLAEWLELRAGTHIPIAGGENLRGAPAFARAARSGALQVIQPDICKWGGFTGCLPAARDAMAQGRRYCPHFLGAGIGLVASCHLLAAAGGDGRLEIDANPNPLRGLLAAPFPLMRGGVMTVPTGHGLGVVPSVAEARPWQVAHSETRR